MRKINEVHETIPKKRIIEVEFYYYIKRLLTQYNNSVVIFDLADAFAQFGQVDPTIIKKLITDIVGGAALWAPTREEAYVIYNKLGYSMRKIAETIGVVPNTQYRIKEQLKTTPISCIPKLSDTEFLSIQAFLEQIYRFREV